MSLSFNPYLLTSTGIPLAYASASMGGSVQIRVYPSTVAFPVTCPLDVASLPAGHILTYTGMAFSATVTPGYIIINGATGTSANTTAAGTLGWMAFMNASIGATSMFITDSIVINGGNGILSVNTLTPTSGQTITISFALKFT